MANHIRSTQTTIAPERAKRSFIVVAAVVLSMFGASCSGGSSSGSSSGSSDESSEASQADAFADDSAGESAGDGTAEAAVSSTSEGSEYGPVVVAGDPVVSLPEDFPGGLVTDSSLDPAIGSTPPSFSGTNFNGGEVSIGPDGRPKAVYFLAHWCPHCQTEVKLINELAADGALPGGVDLYAVAIAVSDERDNYPPSAWLQNFPGTVMRDSETNTALEAGGVGGIPYVLYIDGDNTIVGRSVGSLDADEVLAQWNALAGA